MEDDDDLDPILQQDAAHATAGGTGAMDLDQAAKRDAAELLATPLEAFADLGEQPSPKKLHTQGVRQLTETEVLLELVAMQKPALEAVEAASSTSAAMLSSTGCGGNPAGSSQQAKDVTVAAGAKGSSSTGSGGVQGTAAGADAEQQRG